MNTNIRIKLNHQQIANVAHMLAIHNPMVFGNDVLAIRQELYQRIAQAVETNIGLTQPFTVGSGGCVFLVWVLESDHAAAVGYTHDVDVYVDFGVLLHTMNDELGAGVLAVTPTDAPTPDPKQTIRPTTGPQRVQYVHLRKIHGVVHPITGDVLAEELDRRGGITVAFQDMLNGCVAYSFARCNPVDAYVKRTGRDIAASRLFDPTTRYVFQGTINEFRPWIETNMNAAFC